MYWPAEALPMTREQIAEIEAMAKNPRTTRKQAQRAWIVVMAAEGIPNNAIASTLFVSHRTVLRWRRRFEKFGMIAFEQSFRDETRPGRPPQMTPLQRQQIQRLCGQGLSIREVAAKLGISRSSVHRATSQRTRPINKDRMSTAEWEEIIPGVKILFMGQAKT